jgi:hypothetical protein
VSDIQIDDSAGVTAGASRQNVAAATVEFKPESKSVFAAAGTRRKSYCLGYVEYDGRVRIRHIGRHNTVQRLLRR